MTTTHRSLAFVVHGIGDQPAASTLKAVSENFLPLIRHLLDPHAVVHASPLDETGPAGVTFHFTPKGTVDPYEVRFVEVWWARAFSPPGLGALLMGGAVAFWQRWLRLGTPASSWFTYILRLLGEALSTVVFNLLATVVSILLIPAALVLSIFAAFLKKPLWSPPLANWHEGVLARVGKLQTLIVETAIILLSPVFVVVLLTLWIIESAVPKAALMSPLKEIQAKLVNVLTNQFGDMWCYLYQGWEASRVTSRFEEEFAGEVTKAFQSNQAPESVMVIAHSMGTVVAYEALTGEALRPLITSRFGAAGSAKVTFVSVGSALNLAWDTAPSSERFRFENPLPSEVGWLNLWSEYDPVASEPLRLPKEAWASREASTRVVQGLSAPLQQRGVVNQMDLFSDHSAYWNNAEEVLTPILDRLTNQAFSPKLRLDVPARRIRVRVLAGFKAVAWLMVIAAGFAAFFGALGLPDKLDSLGNWLVSNLRPIIPDDFETKVDSTWKTLTGVVPEPLVEVALVTAIAVAIYSTLVKWAWDMWDQQRKYNKAPGAIAEAAKRENLRRVMAGQKLLPVVDAEIETNHGGNESWQPSLTLKPSDDIDELSEVMLFLNQAGVTTVKAGGSRHSWSRAAASDDVYILPEGMSFVTSVAGDAKQSALFRANSGLAIDDCFLVGSGTCIRDINQALWAKGKAFPLLGGYDGQTLAGVVQTATHGSVLSHGPIASIVQAIILVDPLGRKIRIERAGGPSDPTVFSTLFPGWRLRQDTGLFEAALVSVGTFGVVHSYVVNVHNAFFLREKRSLMRLKDVRPLLRRGNIYRLMDAPLPPGLASQGPTLPDDHPARVYHLEFLVNPHPIDGDHTVVVTSRGIFEPDDPDLPEYARSRTDAQDLLRVVSQSGKFSRPALSTWVSEHVPWLLALIPDLVIRLWPAAMPKVLDQGMRSIVDKDGFEARSYNVFNIGNGQNSIPALSSEPSVPLDHDLYLEALDAILDRAAYFADQGKYHTGPISMRFVRGTDAMLADSEDVCRFEIIFTAGSGHAIDLMRDYEDLLYRRFSGAVRPHWGQINNLNADTHKRLSQMYPRLEAWKQLRREYDPQGIFLNDWQRDLFA